MATTADGDVTGVLFLNKNGDRLATRNVVSPLPTENQVLPAVSGLKP